ncbi:alpha-ketoacid dehydrogenase subunit beta [Azospirillum isscasi]|uniref:Transketolase C-terminal domain-containing protein n=1 Tax=Azospirillum isscasi TaxID=3053926 RepID=A0ABU0WID1_9PROT|nr:transketolase C-terminal domain-containing protein [Azospirillum isscasi]MDQ2103339.1 transketolase C-terminal domain-containing protein [Azospirillum isscasi]
MRVVESLNSALLDLMTCDQRVVLLGEDVLDPYGGAFKVTKGASDRFPDRVWTTPISEGGIVGVANGLAIKGWRPIVEIMFGDFTTLAFDQILNHAAKFAWMYDDQVTVPLVVRTPMGGRRGYGPTHSQSLEKHFCGIPGVAVYAVHQYGSPGTLLREAAARDQPSVFIENKVLYARPVEAVEALPNPPSPDVVILAYGGCVEVAVAAAKLLREEEIAARVVPVTRLWPFPEEEIRLAVGPCRHVLSVEEGAPGWGFAAQCALALVNKGVSFAHIAGPDHPIPSSAAWEADLLPSPQGVFRAVESLLGGAQAI